MYRVCHVTSAHPPEDGRIFRRACQTTVNAGFETYLVQPGESYVKNGIQIVGLGKPIKDDRLYRMTVFANTAYRQALDINADLYHLHDPELLPFAKKIKRQGHAVVFDSHENYVQQIREKEYLPTTIAKVASFLYDVYSRSVFRRIDGLIYAGNEASSNFDSLCPKVVAIDNYPWLNELYEKYDPTIEKEPSSACYIGGLNEARGITQIIKACYGAGYKLYLAGSFNSETYKTKVMSMEEFSCVDYLGMIGRDEIVLLLQRVEVGLSTLLDVGQYYKMHNLPTKVYEYMSMALPVVLNDSLYNMNINQELNFGVCVNPLDLNTFTKILVDLHSDEQKRDTLGCNGRSAIMGRYSWDVEQTKLIDLYDSIFSNQ